MGTISDKLVYLDGTREQIKENLNKFGSNITENDTFRSYSNVINGIYDKLPKVSGNGTDFALENAQNGKLDSFGMDGNTEQTTYSGKNLFKPFNFTKVSYAITFTYSEDGSININGTSTGNALSMISGDATPYLITLQAGTYAISGTIENVRIEVVNSSGQAIGTTGTSTYGTFTISSTTQVFIRANVGSGLTFDNTKVYPQLELSSTATDYEPYVGGTPSPNPDYPQDVKVVKGNNTIHITNSDNTISQEYLLSLGNIELCKIDTYKDSIKKSTGKNLFDKNNITKLNGTIDSSSYTFVGGGSNYAVCIPCKPNTTYTVTKRNDGNTNRFALASSETMPSSTSSEITPVLNKLRNDNSATITLTTGTTANYLIVQHYRNTESVLTEQQILDSIQIEEGSTATSYEPYGTDWYIKKEIGKVVLNGSESWGLNSDNIPFYNLTNSYNGAINLVIPNGYSNYFTLTTGVITSSNSLIGISASASGKYFRIRLETMLSLNDFKTWLSSHNTTVYYILETPTYETITNETLISQLESIETFTGLNNFSVSNENNVLPTLYVSRLKELGKLE